MKKLLIFIILTLTLAAKEPIEPIKPVPYDIQKAKLGMTLFMDTGLSSDNSVSCESCHKFEHGGADNKAFSVGVKGRKGFINSPTVYNAVFNFRQFWNGRAKNLKDQEVEPLRNRHEMNMSKDKIVAYLKSNDYYIKEFKKIFNKEPNFDNMLDSIVEFEKSLVTQNSKFDKYLRKEAKLSKKESEGYALFKMYGCVTCHNGKNVGSNSFQKIGVINPFPWSPKTLDRYAITKNPMDKNVFKVPTLRNVELTAPYFHNGIAKTLKEAIRNMGYYNLGFELEDDEIDKIEAFLKTLTGKKPQILKR